MTNQGEDLKHLTQDYWNDRWERNDIPWHASDVNSLLKNHIKLLDGGRKDLKIFIPLFGKTLDAKWLFDIGHRVVGVDCCQIGLEDFFKENSMEYTQGTKNGIPAFTDETGRIVLYCCDLFDFHKTGEGLFDAVWDRGSFPAFNSRQRTRYAEYLTKLKSKNAPHLLEVYEFDQRLHKAPPFSTSLSEVLEYWGEDHDVKLIDSHEAPEIAQAIHAVCPSFIRGFYLLTLK